MNSSYSEYLQSDGALGSQSQTATTIMIQTAAQCDCKTCLGSGKGWICTCFCHGHSHKTGKESGFFNLMGAMCAEGDKVEAMTDEELLTAFCENVGADERVDSYKCALMDEVLHRFKKYMPSPNAISA